MPQMFIAGQSGNVNGKPRYSVTSVKGLVERFIKRNISPTRLQKLFNKLSEKEKIDVLLALLPYSIAKQTNEGLSKEEIDRIYDDIEKRATDAKKAI